MSRFSPRCGSMNLDAPPFALGQRFFQQFAIFEIYRHVNLLRHIVGRVVLRQHFAQETEAGSKSSSGKSSQKNSRRPTMWPSRMVKSCKASRWPSR